VRSESKKLECIILAAGFSSRLGEEKTLIGVGNQSLIGWVSKRISDRGVEPIVITRPDIIGEVTQSTEECRVLSNPYPERGRTGTIKIGISELDRSDSEGYRLMIVPVDRPGFSNSTLDLMMSSNKSCCPSKNGRGGHPLLLAEVDINRVREAPSDAPLSSIVSPTKIEVKDPFLHLNVDTPEDLIELGKFLSFFEGNIEN
jgi:molybdenum cofactor cytidylyltransferase